MSDPDNEDGNYDNTVPVINGNVNQVAPSTPLPPVGPLTARGAAPLIQKQIG